MKEIIYGSYKGNRTISVPLGRNDRGEEASFTFGYRKAKAIMNHVDEIERFVLLCEARGNRRRAYPPSPKGEVEADPGTDLRRVPLLPGSDDQIPGTEGKDACP